MPIDNQAPVSDPGSISGDPELRTSDPQSNDAERPVTTTDVPAMETDTNPELEGLVTPTPAGFHACMLSFHYIEKRISFSHMFWVFFSYVLGFFR